MKQRRQHAIGATGISRRDALRLGATVAAGAAVGPFVMRLAGAADAFSWQRFKGSKIFLQFSKNPWAETMEKLLPDFEKQTGIKAEFATLPEIQARQRLTVEFTGGSGGIDAWYTSLHVEKRRFWKSGWYLDVGKFLKDPTMTAPDYDWNSDVPDAAKQLVTQRDGTISALIFQLDPWILFYRKDLFQQKGVKPPKSLAEMEELAQRLHSAPSLYGFVARGLKNANAPAWDWVLFSLGGNFQTKDGKASLNTPEAVRAMDYYAGMLKRFAPPGVVNFNWYECSSAFMQNQVAMYFDGVNFAGQFEDKEKSGVAGKVGYTVLPAGPGGHFSPVFGNAVAISAQSKNPGAAYFFAQWATSKQSAIKEQLDGNGSVRTSVWNDPEVKAKTKMPLEWSQAYQDSMKIGRLGLPEIVGVTEYRDIIGVAIQKAIEGAKSADVLAQAQKEFQEVLDQTEK
jgi:multiple sugar transport system substrate-binding protein